MTLADISIPFHSQQQIVAKAVLGSLNLPPDVKVIIRTGRHAHIIPLKFVNITNGVYVDALQFFFSRNGREVTLPWQNACRSCKLTGFTIPTKTVFPLKRCEFENKEYYCPNQVKDFLERWYGDLRPKPPQAKKERKKYN
jgi:hypothetical protein